MPDKQPDLRILQANERTLLAWVRTGLTLMAFGFVIARLAVWLHLEHPERQDTDASSVLGLFSIALGVACHVIGSVRFVRARNAIIAFRPLAPGAFAPVILALTVGALGLIAIILLVLSTW